MVYVFIIHAHRIYRHLPVIIVRPQERFSFLVCLSCFNVFLRRTRSVKGSEPDAHLVALIQWLIFKTVKNSRTYISFIFTYFALPPRINYADKQLFLFNGVVRTGMYAYIKYSSMSFTCLIYVAHAFHIAFILDFEWLFSSWTTWLLSSCLLIVGVWYRLTRHEFYWGPEISITAIFFIFCICISFQMNEWNQAHTNGILDGDILGQYDLWNVWNEKTKFIASLLIALFSRTIFHQSSQKFKRTTLINWSHEKLSQLATGTCWVLKVTGIAKNTGINGFSLAQHIILQETHWPLHQLNF